MKPKNRAQLVRYLKDNPNLRWEYPAGVMSEEGKAEPRKFLRMQNNCFVFETPAGQESFLDAKAKDMTFNEDHFAVSLHRNNLAMKYFYV